MDKSPHKQGAGQQGPGDNHDPLRRAAAGAESGGSFLGTLREWMDALVIAFVLAMFIRTFVVELFKIPSGSMSPTLLGDVVAEGPAIDEAGEKNTYLFIMAQPQAGVVQGEIQIYEKDPQGVWRYQGKNYFPRLTPSQQILIQEKAHREEHRIFVNKFAYWFKRPDRGDIVVFKVPFEKDWSIHARADGFVSPQVPPYNRNTSVYVKRAAAFEGETVEIRRDDPEHRLYIDGRPLDEPEIFRNTQYFPPKYSMAPMLSYLDKVPPGEVWMLGDNSDNSLDSRYWGGVPEPNLRGKAFLRYWPIRKFRFLS